MGLEEEGPMSHRDSLWPPDAELRMPRLGLWLFITSIFRRVLAGAGRAGAR